MRVYGSPPPKPQKAPSVQFTPRGRQTLVNYHAQHYAENPRQHAKALRQLGMPAKAIKLIDTEARGRVPGHVQESGIAPGTGTFVNLFRGATKTLNSGGTELAGIGPGMYHLGGGLIHHPVRTGEQVGKATYHSFGRTIHHPIQQLENDPLGLAANLSIFAAVPGRALATAAEAGRATSLSGLAHAVVKPQAGLRDIKLPGGDSLPGGTASKNYGVAYLQKHGFDRIVQHAVNNPQGAIAKALNHRLVGPEVHVGRLQRAQNRFEQAASTGVESTLARYSQGRMMLRGKKLSGPEEKALQIHASALPPETWLQMERNALHLGAKNPTQMRLTEAARRYFNPDGTLNAKLAPIASEMRQATLERQTLREARGAGTPESHLYRLGALSTAVRHGAGGFLGESPVEEINRLTKIAKPSEHDLVRIDELHHQIMQEGQRVDEAGGHYLPLESNRRSFLGQKTSGSVSLRKGTSKGPPRAPKDYQFGGALLHTGAYRSNATQLASRGLSREKLLARAATSYERLWKQGSPNIEDAGGAKYAHPIRKTFQIPRELKEHQNALEPPTFRKGETTEDVIRQLWNHNSRPPEPHEDVRYIDKRRLGPLKPYEPIKGLEGLDRANQFARFGRFAGPQYAVKWGPQNAIVVAAHQGPMVIRSAAKIVRAMHRLDPVTYDKFAELSGSGAARSLAGDTRFLHGPMGKTAEFFHRAVDHMPRMLVSMHEAHLRGFTKPDQWKALVNGEATTVRGKALDAGQVKRLRQEIFQRGNKEAIDYGAQTNFERATLKKLFVSWPWTGSASRWMARFPIEHPYQGALYSQAGQEGRKELAKYFDLHGQGQVPTSLEASVLKHPNAKGIATAIDTSFLNPGETLGGLGEGIAGLLQGKKSVYANKLASEYAPVTTAVGGEIFGTDHPFRKLENVQPLGAINLARGKGPKTIVGGKGAGLKRWVGLPSEQINVPAAAKAAESKFAATLSPTGKVTERFTQHHKQLEQALKATKSNLTPELQGRLSLRYERAMARARLGGNGRLTPQQRLRADLSVLVEHKWMKPAEMTSALNRAKTASPSDFTDVFRYLTENYFDRDHELSGAYKWLRNNGHPDLKLP